MAIPKMIGVIMAVVTPSEISNTYIKANSPNSGIKLGSNTRSALRKFLRYHVKSSSITKKANPNVVN